MSVLWEFWGSRRMLLGIMAMAGKWKFYHQQIPSGKQKAIENDHRNSGFTHFHSMVNLSIVFCKRLPGRVEILWGSLGVCFRFFFGEFHGNSRTK